PGPRCAAVGTAAGVHRHGRGAMRHLYAGDARDVDGAAAALRRSRAGRGRGARGARRESVPLHRLPEDRRRRARGRTAAQARSTRVRSAVSTLGLVRPKTLNDALRAMAATNGGPRLTPIAGGTDLYVSLNAGSPPGTRYLDLWGLRELRGVRVGRAGVTLGALTTFR